MNMSTLGPLDPIYRRCSVRSYTSQVVDKTTVGRLLHAAVQAPTAMHREPWAFAVIQDKGVLRRYSDLAKSLLVNQAGAVAVLSPDDQSIRDRLLDPLFNIFYDAGTLIVICRQSADPFAEADCWLAAENLMLAAVAEGLGTCCIGFALSVLNTAQARHELGIPDDAAAVAPIIVGVPSGPGRPTPRKEPKVLSWLV
jgi:nitroreductase